MKTKLFNFIIVLLIVFTLVSCAKTEDVRDNNVIIPDDSEIDDNQNNNNNNQNQQPDDSSTPKEVEFSVSLIKNKKIYIPTEEIKVIWADEYSQYSQTIDSTGYAKIKLDGEFNIYLDKVPTGYTYNPNIYKADNENPIVEIELLQISRIRNGTGAENSMYEIKTEGTYRATIKKANQQVFYRFEPSESGAYAVEAIVNVYENVINPKIDTYNGTFAYKNKDKTIDGGGVSLKGGYTKNFKWIINVTDDRIGNVYMFAVYAESLIGVYPFDIDFTLTRIGDYFEDDIVSKLMVAEEAGFKTPEYSTSDYQFKNADGGIGSCYNSRTNGTGLLDGTNFKYNEETGYWHYYDKQTETFGPILCAYITKPCAFYEESLNLIESHGNKNLTVSNSTENYKKFIEEDYAAACNSDGVCYVTMELMEFLQKFSVSQRLFFDGNGFVESTGVFAIEEDQWLFACGYYEEK